VDADEVVLGYEGLDGVARRARIQFEPAPDVLTRDQADYRVALEPGASHAFALTLCCQIGRERSRPLRWEAVAEKTLAGFGDNATRGTKISASNEQFTQWLERSRADLAMMTTETAQGLYPYAGIPWFSTPFGRDGIITALECLWADPELARGVLRFLAAHQATDYEPDRDSEPGKILIRPIPWSTPTTTPTTTRRSTAASVRACTWAAASTCS
jgi:glycogen debranching enzyme